MVQTEPQSEDRSPDPKMFLLLLQGQVTIRSASPNLVERAVIRYQESIHAFDANWLRTEVSGTDTTVSAQQDSGA
jgi:hypothetical protein